MRVPPFERFYEAHRSEVFAFLRRRVGEGAADDAFQRARDEAFDRIFG